MNGVGPRGSTSGGACGAIVVLAGIGLAAIAFIGLRSIGNIKESLDDPAKRAAEVDRILGVDELPAGYAPAIGVNVPLVLDIGMIADSAPDGRAESKPTRGFLFVRLRRWMTWSDDVERIFEGRGHPSRVPTDWHESDIRVTTGKQIGEGFVMVRGREIPYSTHRGELQVDRSTLRGILAVIVVKCDAGQSPGLGAWLVPDPDPLVPVDALDLAGTPADPDALASFLTRFDLCH